MQDFKPSGVITVTTDFGHKGPFVGVMKGVIARRFREALVIDVTHDIPAHWPPEAGFWMSRAYRYFPAGSVHLGIVDPGVGTERDIVLARVGDHLFIAPDNGLLAPLLANADAVLKLDNDRLGALRLDPPSATFHGRDIFAPVAAEIASGRVQPLDIASSTGDWTPGWVDEPESGRNRVSGVIITIDAFGNLISNIDESLICDLDEPRVQVSGHTFALRTTYGNVRPGDYLALINSFGVVEIARAEGSAADGLGTGRGAPVIVSAG